MQNSYVYIIKYKKEVVYIGKGTSNRYLISRNTNTYLSMIPNSFLSISKILTNLTSSRALQIERELIEIHTPIFNTQLNNNFSKSKAEKYLKKVQNEIKKSSSKAV